MDNLIISKKTARKFLVAYHGLDRYSKMGKESAIMNYFHKVGSLQFDPLDICGKNAELVLQSRIRNFKPENLYRENENKLYNLRWRWYTTLPGRL